MHFCQQDCLKQLLPAYTWIKLETTGSRLLP